MLNHTKKCSDPQLLPVIQPKKTHNNSAKKESHKDRNKSLSFNNNMTFQSDPNYET